LSSISAVLGGPPYSPEGQWTFGTQIRNPLFLTERCTSTLNGAKVATKF